MAHDVTRMSQAKARSLKVTTGQICHLV
ncbi:hypothetical protein KCP70_13190 [Salmonella enterica subsp. enterica]|nr:hypothetical protein KCP70_13190 [Salmonella enterica subsp. enterica]